MAKPIILWENELEWASEISCLTSEPDYPVENLKDWREYLIWKSNSASTHTIDITLNTHYFTALEKIRAFALYNYSHSGASTPVALEVRYSSNQVDWTEWFFDENDLVSGEPYIYIDPTGVPYPNIYWQVIFYSQFPSQIVAQVGLMFLGDYLEFPCYPERGFDPNSEEVILEPTRSERGYLLGVVEKYRQRRLSVEFPFLPDSWVRNNFLPFWNEHIPKPFLFVWDYENHPREIYLVEMAEPRLEVPYNPIYRSLRLEMVGRKA